MKKSTWAAVTTSDRDVGVDPEQPSASHRTAGVCGVEVADLPQEEVISLIARPALDRPRFAYALHVGGVNSLGDTAYRRALGDADIVYADGSAVVMLARLGGAQAIERAATTDIGLPVMTLLRERLGRPLRIAMLGGPPGLADRAASAVREGTGSDVVLIRHGYVPEQEQRGLLQELRRARPDVILVGLGCPREAIWCHRHRDELPPALILTCGGWFGFLAGDEHRAPAALQRSGLEWSYRLRQDYKRLRRRYAVGALLTASAVPGQLVQRRTAHP